jgi:hypothetical protein
VICASALNPDFFADCLFSFPPEKGNDWQNISRGLQNIFSPSKHQSDRIGNLTLLICTFAAFIIGAVLVAGINLNHFFFNKR